MTLYKLHTAAPCWKQNNLSLVGGFQLSNRAAEAVTHWRTVNLAYCFDVVGVSKRKGFKAFCNAFIADD